MLTNRRFYIAITAAALVACGGSSHQPTAPQPPPSEAHAHADSGGTGGMCPAEVPGTQVSAIDTQDGVAITFTTTGDVAQLRQRVHHMGEMHEHMMGEMGSGHMAEMVPSSARVEDIDGGARLVLTPNDPAKLAELRTHVHDHATQMASGHCPMMEHHG